MARFRLTSPKIELSENEVEKQCLDVLRLNRFSPLRLQSGLFIAPDREVIQALKRLSVRPRWITIGERGIPDYVIPAFFLEVKRPGGELSPEQTQKIWELEKIWGLQTIVIDNVAELIAWLDRRAKP